jgi:hypothetical protein
VSEIEPAWLVGVTGVIGAVGTFIAGQRHGKAEFITAVSKAADLVITKLQEECKRFEEARIKADEGHAKCETELAKVRMEIAVLMAGRVALPGEKAPVDG